MHIAGRVDFLWKEVSLLWYELCILLFRILDVSKQPKLGSVVECFFYCMFFLSFGQLNAAKEEEVEPALKLKTLGGSCAELYTILVFNVVTPCFTPKTTVSQFVILFY